MAANVTSPAGEAPSGLPPDQPEEEPLGVPEPDPEPDGGEDPARGPDVMPGIPSEGEPPAVG